MVEKSWQSEPQRLQQLIRIQIVNVPDSGYLDAPVGPIAQRSEQATHNRLVAGSNPAGPTNFPNKLAETLNQFRSTGFRSISDRRPERKLVVPKESRASGAPMDARLGAEKRMGVSSCPVGLRLGAQAAGQNLRQDDFLAA